MPLALLDAAAIESARFTIRPVRATDLGDLLQINGDAQVTRFLPYPTWRSREDGAAWLTRMEALGAAGTGRQLVIVRQADAKVIGTVLLFKYDPPSGRLELGYVLGRSHWGRGQMREAVAAVCNECFTRQGIRRIEAEVNPANAASCRLLLALGFVHEGTLRKRWLTDGVAYDTQLFGCLAEDWRHAPAP